MREILFRGKKVGSGDWVYGFFGSTSQGKYYIDTYGESTNFETMSHNIVIPETVSQFTGLTDKNGKKIFEGDIVRILYTDWCSKPETDTRTLDQYLTDIASVGVVIWEGDKYYVSIKSKKYKDTSFNDSIFPGKHGYIEVIGNIHDNQDLL